MRGGVAASQPEQLLQAGAAGEAETAVPPAPLADEPPSSPFNFDLDLSEAAGAAVGAVLVAVGVWNATKKDSA